MSVLSLTASAVLLATGYALLLLAALLALALWSLPVIDSAALTAWCNRVSDLASASSKGR